MNVVLLPPRDGWSRLQIGSWSDRLSYVDDPAVDLLHAMNHVLVKRSPCAVKFDAEGYCYTLVFDDIETHIITETDGGFVLNTIEVDIEDIALSLASQIIDCLDAWAEFPCSVENDQDQIEKRKSDIDLLAGLAQVRAERNMPQWKCQTE